MKKIIFYFFWSFLCLHTSVNFSHAEGTSVSSTISEIDTFIADSLSTTGSQINISNTGDTLELNSAPLLNQSTTIHSQVLSHTPITYTPWEMIHRIPLLKGYTWTGSVSNYITPAMYLGTPHKIDVITIGYDPTLGATNYSECIRMETDFSFGPNGVIIEDSVEDELRSIAKYCALEFYGNYFNGKKYTTREEMLMMLFTMFDEEVFLPGYFHNNQFISDNQFLDVPYSNISYKSWFAPFVTLAYDLVMVEDETTWEVAREVTNKDIEMMIKMYLLDEDGTVVDGIDTEYGTYALGYYDGKLVIEKE